MEVDIFEKVEEIKKIILEKDYDEVKSYGANRYSSFIKNNQKLDMYSKNLLALLEKNPNLGVKLAYSSQGDYEIFQANDGTLNVINSKTLKYLHQNPQQHQKYWQDLFNSKYNRYQVLYFYGIGLGEIYKKLPENIKKVIIFEDDINMLYIALNLNDFCVDLLDETIEIFDKNIKQTDVHTLYNKDEIKSQIKLYDMLIYSDFYNDKVEYIKAINKTITDEYAKIVAANGNDMTDALIGIRNFMLQIPNIVKSYNFTKLIEKKKNGAKNAIIVSTGPSLHKQLELLRQNQDFFYIISVDASLKILLDNDIVPDFVTSLERVEATSSFFDFTEKERLKDTYMVVLALTHEKTSNNILTKQNTRLSMCFKPLSFEMGFELHDRGYMGYGMSSANIALELALKLFCENIVFIGQDLAFAKDGRSHSKGHIYGENEQSENLQKSFYVKGWYEDSVPTMYIWDMFRSQLQKLIDFYQDRNYYNCTEGGAWIEGCKHISFVEFLNKYAIKDKKSTLNIDKPNDEEIKAELEKIKSHISRMYQYEKMILDTFKSCFLEIANACDMMEEKEPSIDELVELNTKIDKIKDIVEAEEFCKYYMEILQPRLISFELDLAVIAAKSVNSQEDKLEKLKAWIKAHKIWLFNICGAIEVMGENVRKYSKNLVDELDKYGIDNDILRQEYEKISKAFI